MPNEIMPNEITTGRIPAINNEITITGRTQAYTGWTQAYRNNITNWNIIPVSIHTPSNNQISFFASSFEIVADNNNVNNITIKSTTELGINNDGKDVVPVEYTDFCKENENTEVSKCIHCGAEAYSLLVDTWNYCPYCGAIIK